jgi:hypothetical protein
MKLEFRLINDLPRLAWAAHLYRDPWNMEVLHGPWVEVRPDCFFEGAWNGPLELCRFDEAATMAGSGGRVTGDQVVFAAPSHMSERLYSFRAGGELFVSNSLPFVLAWAGQQLDPGYPHYFLDFRDFHRAGISVTKKQLRLLGPQVVELHDCCNLVVTPDLAIARIEKPQSPPPRDYHDYVSFLERTLAEVASNASDPARGRTYRMVTMLSQGYDSTAVAALASRAGCREAVTYRKSASGYGYVDDSGTAIAAHLGLDITEYERWDYDKLPESRDDEFYVDPRGGDPSLVLMERQLMCSLLLSGRGGLNWGPSRRPLRHRGFPPEHGLPLYRVPGRKLLGGASLGEFRLKTGFIHFPLSYSGRIHSPVLQDLSVSEAMQPWSIGGAYDCPIARRIAEEAGVPRHLFGQVKKGGPGRKPAVARSFRRRTLDLLEDLSLWAPTRALFTRLLRSRFGWQRSFFVQRGVERVMERYRAAIFDGQTRDSTQRLRALK